MMMSGKRCYDHNFEYVLAFERMEENEYICAYVAKIRSDDFSDVNLAVITQKDGKYKATVVDINNVPIEDHKLSYELPEDELPAEISICHEDLPALVCIGTDDEEHLADFCESIDCKYVILGEDYVMMY